jgi:hypothetical protein
VFLVVPIIFEALVLTVGKTNNPGEKMNPKTEIHQVLLSTKTREFFVIWLISNLSFSSRGHSKQFNELGQKYLQEGYFPT